MWSDGTPWSFEAWHGKPSNSWGGEDCLTVSNSHNERNWNDLSCEKTRYLICKFSDTEEGELFTNS